MNNKFTNKEEYLAYRSEWKDEYKQLSQHIKDFKFALWYQKLGDKRKTPLMKVRFEDIKKVYKTDFFYVWGLKKRATSMLMELKHAKVEAQRQYKEAKNLLTIS